MEKKVAEKSTSSFVLIKRIKKWVEPHYFTFFVCLLLLLLSSAIQVSGSVIIQQSIDNYISKGNFQGLLLFLGSYIALLGIGLIANYVEIIKLETVGQVIVAEIKKSAFKHIITLNMSYFDKSTTGKLVSRIENDSNSMLVLFTSVITNVLGSLLLLMGNLAIMSFLYNSKMALVLLLFLPFMLVGGYIFDKFMGPKLINIRKAVSEVSSYVTEIIHGISIIQIFNQENKVIQELERRSNEKLKMESFISVMFNSFFNILFSLQIAATGIILYIGTDLVIKGEMTQGSLVLFINSVSQFFMPIMHLSGQFNEFQKGIAGANRIFDLFDTDNNILEPEKPITIPNKEHGINIEFRNVWFKYNDNTDWVLEDVSFFCPAGEHWALVGPTGSGKTSIISLLLKFYLPQKGSILLNGINIADISKEELMKAIGLVLQENILFPGSVYDNLNLNKTENNEENIFDLMKDLGIHQSINKLPQGYATELRENGANLSAGEKQIISFGRALLKNPPILIFDEATSNIDPEMENNIKVAMNKLISGRTSLIIAHRLSTIQNADRIIVLKYGKLIETGSHKELMKTGGFYAELNKLQSTVVS